MAHKTRTCHSSKQVRLQLEHLPWDLDHLDYSERDQLTQLITSLDASELGTTTLVQHVPIADSPACEEDTFRSAIRGGQDGGRYAGAVSDPAVKQSAG